MPRAEDATGCAPTFSAAARKASAADYRILLQSDRDGMTRGYSIRPDGSLLTPLVPANRPLVPASVSVSSLRCVAMRHV